MNLSSNCNGDYAKQDYWDRRYEKEEEFEWCKDYSILKPLLVQHIRKSDSILMLGCGNSLLSSSMYNDGFESITNIDLSSVVISKMSEEFPNIQWHTMDMLNLEFPDSTFDIVIEKATLDVLFVDEKSPWTVSEEVSSNMNKVLVGVSRVLKPTGKFISITFAQPHFRNKFYKDHWTNCGYETFGTGFHYYLYVNSNIPIS